MTGPPAEVAAAFDAAPPAIRARLLQMRALILNAADATGAAPLTETLKWGQPAYLPRRRDGTTVRLGWKTDAPDHAQMLVHCQTDLVARWRQIYPEEFDYVDNRAVLVPAEGPYPEAAVQQMAAMALTYHRDRAKAMKITRITVFQKDLPLEHPYWLSGGRLKFEVLDATFVKLETDAGITGWGEGTPWGHTYVPAHGPGIRAGLQTMAPFLLGLDPRRVLEVERAMDLALPGHLYAKAPVDMACWDIAGQAAGLPIADLMGGGSRTPRPIAASVGARDIEETRAVIDRYRARGYVAFSVKIGGDPARDIARIHDVENRRKPGEILLYDVNRAWSRAQALQVLRAVDPLQVTVEQPCESLDDIAAIHGRHATPVSVDESLVTLQDATRIAGLGLAEVFGIKLNRVGGLTRAARMRDIALAHGIDMFVMATGGSVLADGEALHLAATVPDQACRAVWSCQDMLSVDIAGGRGPRNADGHLHLPGAPGLGVQPDKAALREVARYG